jgi:hypothetical protein
MLAMECRSCRDAQDDSPLWIRTTTKVRLAVVLLSIADEEHEAPFAVNVPQKVRKV